MPAIIPLPEESLISAAKRCDAIYICPKDAEGNRLGDLVVYAGIGTDGNNKVGDIYFNFAMLEMHQAVVEAYALKICDDIRAAGLENTIDAICGIPEGGRTLGQAIARILEKEFIYPTKVPTDTPEGQKQRYAWEFNRFAIAPGTRIAVVDDVNNSFTNTDTVLGLIKAAGGIATALLSALNRSVEIRNAYIPKDTALGEMLPVIAAINEPYPEFNQSDDAVKGDIAAGKLELKVKANWPRLKAIMEKHAA